MTVIDAHVHLYPPEVNRDPGAWANVSGEPHWAILHTRRRRNGQPVQSFPNVDGLLRAMDAAGVARAILQGWYWHRPDSCSRQNRFYADCIRAHPDRLSAFATVAPSSGQESALAEVQWAREHGFLGLGELSPHSQGYPIDDVGFQSVLARAAELNFPVNVHVTDPESREYPGKIATPLDDFIRLAREHPKTTFIFAHWGGLLPWRFPEVNALRNVYYDTAASPLLYDASIWMRFIDAVAVDRVIFGSDFPLNLYPGIEAEVSMTRFINEARESSLPSATLTAIMAENARKLFGW